MHVDKPTPDGEYACVIV